MRMPVLFIPHGGGPWPFVELGMVAPQEVDALAGYLRGLPSVLSAPPRALLVISAHWVTDVPTVMTAAEPPLLYDYFGFPPESYAITWPAPGAPDLAARIRELLDAAGFATAADPDRGFDHGTFIPLKVAWPAADVPTLQLSVLASMDPAGHLALGRALASLRDEGILIVGSGMSFHNLRMFMTRQGHDASVAFDAWLRDAATAPPDARNAALSRWTEAPHARVVHPHEDHLIPLMVVAGAAGADVGRVAFNGTFGNAVISAFHYGA
ncbi:MAG: class III extradiol ring-cleavage dioxygenase [Vicinamibacterales bacterium]